ncbi:MAG: type I glyceraldehyde-3-phosphate dehydrogenase [Deltaproteobacteria bacterium]|nr:MAG: type I glyceraldehyde-3-phosphate dehydrogenase [Deltaproteobacteria bacterium]PIE74946.1 MAG: type I glyceraldehyde-3-phosphate dehydrogenase [Deltaproteobacteria bacterium]
MSIKIGINGFGRIGRSMLRAAIENKEVEIAAINDLAPCETMAHLIKYDSVHGVLDIDVKSEKDSIIIDGKKIPYTSFKDPKELPWKENGIDIAAECTGLFKDRESAYRHLEAGAKKVLISAPAKDPDTTIVLGVNQDTYEPSKHNIISNASCTTNCLAPVAKVLKDNFGIKYGFMTTVHSYTGAQRILDAPHKDLRRARAAGVSMVPTTTGAAKAVGLVIPELQGKLNGLSMRVPTPNVSIIDFVINAEKKSITKEDVNNALKEAANGSMKGILGYCEEPLVSIDFNGNRLSSIVDSLSTDVIEDMVKVLSWYDNETGYSTRMVDLAAFVGRTL